MMLMRIVHHSKLIPRMSQMGAWANISSRCNRNEPICFSAHLYRARDLVEWFFNKIKQCRRIATRYDKLAANYLAFVQLASIRLWLRVHEFHLLVRLIRYTTREVRKFRFVMVAVVALSVISAGRRAPPGAPAR